MKVKVSYTVNIEEVSEVVQKLLSSVSSRLAKHTDISANIFQADETINSLISAHKDISLAESQISDCINIIQGFLDTVRTDEVEQQTDEPSLEDGDEKD
jgi:hypothetical protein